jgi:2-haloacid dehalogenase
MPVNNRRLFIKTLAAAMAAGAVSAPRRTSAMQTSTSNPESRPSTSSGRPEPVEGRIPNPGRIKALVFDAYGTLFDVFSVTSLCEQLFPGNGNALAQMWRAKQLQYSLLRSMMGRYKDFWQVTQDGLVYSAHSLELDLTAEKRTRLMDAYLTLAAFPDVKPGLQQLKAQGLHLAILSNGEPKMLQSAAKNAGITDLLDAIVSVDEIKVFKPSPRVYELVASHVKTAKSDIGFVSSNNWDANGAGSAGLTAFWIQRAAAEPPEELDYPAARVVSAITDLPALVR